MECWQGMNVKATCSMNPKSGSLASILTNDHQTSLLPLPMLESHHLINWKTPYWESSLENFHVLPLSFFSGTASSQNCCSALNGAGFAHRPCPMTLQMAEVINMSPSNLGYIHSVSSPTLMWPPSFHCPDAHSMYHLPLAWISEASTISL